MSKIVLEGGTDIAEMVLFSVDDLPPDSADDETLAELVRKKQAIRMLTGGDGDYLLHVHVDEEIPDYVEKYCVTDDSLESELQVMSGLIAFGGAESTYAEFEPNSNIRSDGSVPPGVYDATVYHTEFPDELIDEAIESAIGSEGKRVLDFPGSIMLRTMIPTILMMIVAVSGFSIALVGAAAAIIVGIFWFRSYTSSDKYIALEQRSREVQREYPSIVAQIVKRGA